MDFFKKYLVVFLLDPATSRFGPSDMVHEVERNVKEPLRPVRSLKSDDAGMAKWHLECDGEVALSTT